MPRKKTEWDSETYGYGKHDYRTLDPDAVNVEDFAKDMRGDVQHKGDVREENTAYNIQSPDNNLTVDLLAKRGTVFETEAEGYEGTWIVTNVPVVKSPNTYCRARRAVKVEGKWQPEMESASAEEQISCVELGNTVGVGNKFRQVKTTLIKKGKHLGQ